MIVEGAGGLFSPLGDATLNIDLARDLDLPLVVVDAARLGAIGRTLAVVRAARAEGRFFYDDTRRNLGELGSTLDLADVRTIGLVDDWLGIDARLSLAEPSNGLAAGLWTFPVQSVSQSEGGFELVHQSVVVMPHWIVTPDADGVWKVAMRLSIGNLKAESCQRPVERQTARV